MACKIIYKGKALPEEEAKIEINNDVVDDLNEQAVGKSIINSALLTDEEINQQITDLNKFKTVIENNYFKLEDNISVSSLVINKHIKNAPASLGKVKIDSKWRTKEEAKKQVEENLKQRKLFSKLKRNFGITEEQLNLIENVSADKVISSAEDLINAIESKLLSLNSLVLNSKKSKKEGIAKRIVDEEQGDNFRILEYRKVGSKQDIEGFKDFVQGKQDFDKELAQKIQDKLQKLYPEIKLNITNVPVWEQGDNVFNQELEEQINNFVLFENQDKLCPSGICNYTAKASTEHLQKIGLNPYPSNYNGSQLPVKVKSPIGYFNIEHYVSAVAINNAIYIYDMPQNEFISNEFFGKGSDVKIKESYKPRLIPLTIDEIKSNYNLSTQEAGNFIHSIINNNGWKGADAAPSFRKYIENNIKNSQEYINLLEAQIKDFDYEFEQWDVEEYRREIKDKRDALKTKKVTKEEEQKVIKYYENKLKLKTKEYLPKRAGKFSLKTLVDSVIGRGFDSSIDFSSFETALESLDKYLKSEIFIEDLLNKVTIAKENLDSINESINQVYSLAKLFASFTKQVKVYGIEEAVKKYDSKQQYTIRTLLPSNVLDKYKSKEQAALLLQKYWGNKDNIVKQLNIFKNTTFTDLITNRFKAHSVFNKYQTVLNFLKSTDFDSSYLYQVISNEAIRKYTYFDKIGNTQFQKDEFNRIIGQANIKAMTVLVDAIKQKQDTLPHEYAHHYIAWFRDTPIVQEAIKKWGSEEALVQSIGEQVVKQKGEAYNWWNKFVKWIMNQFNSLSKLQKEELTQILTDAFLTRQDLNNINNQQFQKLTSEEKVKTIEQVTKEHRSITALKDLAHKLAYRIGSKVEFDNRTDVDWKGYNQGMKSVLNEAYMTPDTPFHEILAHPIIRAIKNRAGKDGEFNWHGPKGSTNSELYNNLIKELETGRGREVFEQVKRDYVYKDFKDFDNIIDISKDFKIVPDAGDTDKGKYYLTNDDGENFGNYNLEEIVNKFPEYFKPIAYTLEEQQEEAVVQLLGLMAADKLDKIKDKNLISLLKELLLQMSEYIKSLFTTKEIRISELNVSNLEFLTDKKIEEFIKSGKIKKEC